MRCTIRFSALSRALGIQGSAWLASIMEPSNADTLQANSSLIWNLDALHSVGEAIKLEHPQVLVFLLEQRENLCCCCNQS